jgi:hypothetical protein
MRYLKMLSLQQVIRIKLKKVVSFALEGMVIPKEIQVQV